MTSPISSCHESLPASFQTNSFLTFTVMRCSAAPRRPCCTSRNAIPRGGNNIHITPSSHSQHSLDPSFASSRIDPTISSRRSFLSLITIGASLTSPLSFSIMDATNVNVQQTTSSMLMLPSASSTASIAANAAETIGKEESCNDASCLGVWDGLLADCPHDKRSSSSTLFSRGAGAGCVSSQDDTPGIFAEPWDYSESIPLASSTTTSSAAASSSYVDNNADEERIYKHQMDLLILALETTSRQHDDDMQILYQEGRYIRVLFTDGLSGEKSVGEFYFTPLDTTVQFRIGSTTAPPSSSSSTRGIANVFGRSTSNMERSERLRKALRYLKVPVLRNRKRALFFVESELDSFGPGSAALGPPEEMSPGELIGR
jgi:hypothetical protein